MAPPFVFYAKVLSIFVSVSLMAGLNFMVWGLHREVPAPVFSVLDEDSRHGRKLIETYGCGACHAVPGVPGANGNVGPHLDRLINQMYVSGVLPNHPANVTRWIMTPREVDPHTAMPDLEVSEEDARKITAYLFRRR